MAALARSVTDAWYRRASWLYALWPLSGLFWLLITGRRTAFQLGLLRSRRPRVPVVVVGNINVGGSGKTPLVIALVEQLQAAGYRPGIASRGYGSKAPSYPYAVTPADTAVRCGDEPLLIVRRTGAPLVIDADRAAAAQCLVDQHDCDVVVTDDGLQHYALGRDLEIIVVDAARGFGTGWLLPAGPLREPLARLRQADWVITQGRGDQLPGLAATPFAMQLEPQSLVALSSGERASLEGSSVEGSSVEGASVERASGEGASGDRMPAEGWTGPRRVHAVAGIGHPERFFNTLRELGFEPIEHPLPDHHALTPGELDFGDALPVIMTEKDAVKLPANAATSSEETAMLLDRCWMLTVSARLDDAFFSALKHRLHAITPTTDVE